MKLIEEPKSAIEIEKLTPDEHILLQARRNLLLAAHTLAQALLTVGEPKMAIAVAELGRPSVYPELREVAVALSTHDDDRCACVYKVETFHPNAPHFRGDEQEERKYLSLGRAWCDGCEAMVTAYKCHLCGHLMHTTGAPDQLHAQIGEAQTNMLSRVTRSLLDG